MEVILNRIFMGTQEPNEVLYLGDLRKDQVLETLHKAAMCPESYTIASASKYRLVRVEPKDMITLREWLEEQEIELSQAEYARLRSLASKLYLEKYGQRPRDIFRRSEGNNKFTSKFKGYDPHCLRS